MNRYSRQEILKNIGQKGQKILLKSSVAIIGCGGLGSSCAELLSRAGVGRLEVYDSDVVEENNLQRQTMYTEKDIGVLKVFALRKRLKEVNKTTLISAKPEYVNSTNINIKSKIILDCTDNLHTRFLLNEYAIKKNKTLIYGSVIRDKGFVYVVTKNKPCLRCFLKNSSTETCGLSGIYNTIIKVVSAVQVHETLKVLLKKTPEKDLLFFDLESYNFKKITVKKNKECSVCAKKYFKLLTEDSQEKIVRICGKNQFKTKISLNKIQKLKNKRDKKFYYTFKGLKIFKNGLTIIDAKDENTAKKILRKHFGD